MARIIYQTDEMDVQGTLKTDLEFSALRALTAILDELETLRQSMEHGIVRIHLEKKVDG